MKKDDLQTMDQIGLLNQKMLKKKNNKMENGKV